MLSEKSPYKDKYCVFSLIRGLGVGKSAETESRVVSARGWGRGGWGVV